MPSDRTLASIRFQSEPEVHEVHGADGPLHRYPCGCDWWSGSDRWRLCPYHQGFDDAAEKADALQAGREADTETLHRQAVLIEQLEARNADQYEELMGVMREVGRLRAERRRLTDENARAWNACNEECQRKEHLQAVIDAYAEASTEDDQYDHLRYMRSIGDLLDAATKEDDSGK